VLMLRSTIAPNSMTNATAQDDARQIVFEAEENLC
jgi:hypothetical protein